MPKQKQTHTVDTCPCGSAQSYLECCQSLHNGHAKASTAEQLMRSRYSAYVYGLEDYLLNTWHPDTRPTQLNLSQDKDIKWLRLAILNKSEPQMDSSSSSDPAIVEFIAYYKHHGKAEKMHEKSRFLILTGDWYYLNGEMRD